MIYGHNPYLVALSVLVAILGGYTGFGLAARMRAEGRVNPRLLLAAAAAYLAVGIWTMHFIGMLAAPIPAGAVYLALPTIVSFLICALVVGIAVFLVSLGNPPPLRVAAAAVLMGIGIVSMHYVGIYALAGPFRMEHDPPIVALAVLIAIASAYGGLRIFLAGPVGTRLAFSAIIFGIAVSGMHYTAMYGMRFRPMPAAGDKVDGLVASVQLLSIIVALLTFALAASFLLFLVPDQPHRVGARADAASSDGETPAWQAGRFRPAGGRPASTAPLRGLGQPRIAPLDRLPVEAADGTQFVDACDVRSVKADAHYTFIHDGRRERMCLLSISEVEARLDPMVFLRVHRSHIVALPHVSLLRKEGDGGVVELNGEVPHLAPVSRARLAELRARLGLSRPGGSGSMRKAGHQS